MSYIPACEHRNHHGCEVGAQFINWVCFLIMSCEGSVDQGCPVCEVYGLGICGGLHVTLMFIVEVAVTEWGWVQMGPVGHHSVNRVD